MSENIDKRRERQRRYYYRNREKRLAWQKEYENKRYKEDKEFAKRKANPVKNPYAFAHAHACYNYGWFARIYPDDFEQTIYEALARARATRCITIKKRLISVVNSCFYRNICELGYAKIKGKFVRRP